MGTEQTKLRVLVTGGGGFLGQAILRQLLDRGYETANLSRSRYPKLELMGVRCFEGDIRSYEDVLRAAQGCDAIIHTAAKAGMWGDYEEYFAINVTGTANVIRACRELNIQRLVYTSSPSVTFDGKDQEGIDESAPYPKSYTAAYPETKAIAEQLALKAKSPNLAVCALRPHLIWGPGDNHLAPRLVDRARKNRLRFIGQKGHKVDAVYIDNAAEAHILALEGLHDASPINGKTFFITNQDPWPIEELINRILFCWNAPKVKGRISSSLAYAVGVLFEGIYRCLRIKKDPPMTRFVAQQLSTSHWYSEKGSRELLGYVPSISMEEGFARLRASVEAQS